MTPADVPFDPDKMYAVILTAGEEWADRKAAYEALEDLGKTVLAEIGFDYPNQSGIGQERLARSSQRWKEHLNELSLARKTFLLAEVRYKTLVMLAENRRSQEATRRAETRIV